MGHSAAMESEVLRDHMGLVAHCCINERDQGMPRSPGHFLLTTLNDAWVCEVHDPDAGRYFAVLGLTVDGVLAVANALVSSDAPPWRPVKKSR